MALDFWNWFRFLEQLKRIKLSQNQKHFQTLKLTEISVFKSDSSVVLVLLSQSHILRLIVKPFCK